MTAVRRTGPHLGPGSDQRVSPLVKEPGEQDATGGLVDLQPDWEGNARSLLHDLAGAFAFAIGHIADTWA